MQLGLEKGGQLGEETVPDPPAGSQERPVPRVNVLTGFHITAAST